MKGNTMKKYELIESDKVSPRGTPLFQVVAIRDFGTVKKGYKGGYIESEANLSHEDNCWVYGNARVYDNARALDDAQVYGNALVYGNAQVCDRARVCDRALVCDSALICGNALVFDDAQVCDDVLVSGNAQVCDRARVFNTARVYDDARVSGTAWVFGNARIFRDTQITAGHAFATKDNSWDITEVDNGNGTSTLYADAVFELAEPACDHVTGGVPDEEGKAIVFRYCPKCGEKL